MTPWTEFWRSYWKHYWALALPPPKPASPRSLDELAVALEAYLASAQVVAIGAAKNVEDARLILKDLKAAIERKRQCTDQSPPAR